MFGEIKMFTKRNPR